MTTELSLNSLLVVPLAPLVGSIAAGLFGKVIGRRGAHVLTILTDLLQISNLRLQLTKTLRTLKQRLKQVQASIEALQPLIPIVAHVNTAPQ